jgi:DNA-binding NtrC family response regulator
MLESILIIGIDRYDREIITKLFSEKYGLTFIDKTDRRSWCATSPFFKLVIYNMGIPDEESLQTLQSIKNSDSFERPVIVITSQNTVDVDRFLATTGVFYHLVRPFEIRDLDDLISGALRFWKKKLIDVPAQFEPRKAVRE